MVKAENKTVIARGWESEDMGIAFQGVLSFSHARGKSSRDLLYDIVLMVINTVLTLKKLVRGLKMLYST